jgi:hypothetical protein
MRRAIRPFSVAALLVAGVTVHGAVKFTSTYAAPDARSVSFKGQKVAALVMSDSFNLRMSAEEALARELTARGMMGIAAYKAIPKEELQDVERAKAWFERVSVAGVVVLRPVSREKVIRPTVEVWTSASYSTLWGYYPYGWAGTSSVVATTEDTYIVVEALIYQVATGGLVWGGVSEATNPKNLQKLVGDIVKEAANKIRREFR